MFLNLLRAKCQQFEFERQISIENQNHDFHFVENWRLGSWSKVYL